jgi:CBS domain-containing protein
MKTKPVAADIMATKLHTLAPDTRVSDAMDIFLKKRISGAPVLDGDRLVGVISEKDCMRFLLDGLMTHAPDATVASLMSKDVETITPDVSLLVIAEIFFSQPYRRLPVVEDGQLVGQVSRRDVLRAMQELHKKQSRNVSSSEAVTRQGAMTTTPGTSPPDLVGPETNKRFH